MKIGNVKDLEKDLTELIPGGIEIDKVYYVEIDIIVIDIYKTLRMCSYIINQSHPQTFQYTNSPVLRFLSQVPSNDREEMLTNSELFITKIFAKKCFEVFSFHNLSQQPILKVPHERDIDNSILEQSSNLFKADRITVKKNEIVLESKLGIQIKLPKSSYDVSKNFKFIAYTINNMGWYKLNIIETIDEVIAMFSGNDEIKDEVLQAYNLFISTVSSGVSKIKINTFQHKTRKPKTEHDNLNSTDNGHKKELMNVYIPALGTLRMNPMGNSPIPFPVGQQPFHSSTDHPFGTGPFYSYSDDPDNEN